MSDGNVDAGAAPSSNLDEMAVDPAELPVPIGQVIAGRYAVTGVLGRGGMGVVLSARHVDLGERVAIKFLNREHSAHADRFFREARAAARIRGEHVVRIFDVGRLESGEPYIVMEFLEGEDLADRLDRQQRLDATDVAAVLMDVCLALAEAHAAGIVHRDLKPANIFLAHGPDGSDLVKLLDFGVAKMPEAGALTQTSTVLGSPIYMSPEQLMASRNVDPRSDIWSLGVILYEALTAELPFLGDSLVHLALIVREKPTPSARALRPELPEALDGVIATCLAKDRADRYADVADFADAIAPFAPPGAADKAGRVRRVLTTAKARRDSSPELEQTVEAPSSDSSAKSDRSGSGNRGGSHGSGSRDSFDRITTYEGKAKSSSGEESAPRPSDPSIDAMATSTVSAHQDRPPAPPARLPAGAKVGIGVAAVVVAIVGAWQAIGRPASGHDDRPVLTAPSPPVESHSAAAPVSAAPSVPVPSAEAAPAPLPSPTASVSVAMTTKPVHRDPPKAIAPTTSASAAKPVSVNCNPPFTIDEKGVRRIKPECQ